MDKFESGIVTATVHYAVSYCVVGETKKTTLDFPTASLDIERENICLEKDKYITRLRLTNISGSMLKLINAYPIITDDLKIGDTQSSEWSFFCGSRQLNDVPATCTAGVRDFAFKQCADRLGDEGLMPRDYSVGDAVLYGDGIGVIKAMKTYVSLEVMTNDIQLTDISVSLYSNGEVKALRAGGEFNCLLNDGDTVYTDWVCLGTSGNFTRLLEEYALNRKAMNGIKTPRVPEGIYVLNRNDLQTASEKISFLKGVRAPFDYIEIGKGWQNSVGDWEDGENVSIRNFASLINKSGYKAGLWTSPFLVEKNSQIYESEKHWVLRHADGSVCTYETNGTTYAILDVSSEDVLDWLSMTYCRLSANGVYMHHIDHTGAFVAQKDIILSNPEQTMVSAYRKAFRVISDAIGDEGRLFVTDGFIPALCGVADVVQVCSEKNMFDSSRDGNSLPKIINQSAFRAHMSSWWNNFSGETISFDEITDDSDMKYRLVSSYISGSGVVTSDIDKNDELKILKTIYPPVKTVTYPRDAFGEETYISVVDVEVNDSYHTLCFFNHSFTHKPLSFRLDSKTCGGYVDHASKYNISSYFGRTRVYDCKYDELINLGNIPPNSCEIVKIAKSDKPQVTLSNMHFSMGGELNVFMTEDSVRVVGENPFNCKGNYVVALPEEYMCNDGRKEFSFTVNGAGAFTYEKPVRRKNDIV